ncbi:MAG: DNA-3-methyladenine glycosylase I [Myxococcales bacterium]|nr:DNA-3-methyladenine glycosylase I [Myxococcales bacterium]MDH3484830.1 DNA-3-methyladenine glycosylase I [Myxococcales bacterium]
MAPKLPKGLVRGDDDAARCLWCGDAPDYRVYHDREWGWPVHDDRQLLS